MSETRDRYDDAFKKDAVALSYSCCWSVKRVAETLGVSSQLLRQWRKEYRETCRSIAEDILKFDIGPWLGDRLNCYIEDPVGEEQRLTPVLSFIHNDGYDISGFDLFEIPITGVYCFWNKSTQKRFDILVFDTGDITAGYVSGEEVTSNIEEAIQRYESINHRDGDV